MHKLAKAGIMREVKDYAYITLGLISYSLGWAAFLLPYQITTGGTTGISAIIYYSTGFPIQWSYFIINAVLMTFAIRILGPRFSIKTTYAIFMLTFLLWLFQLLINNYVEVPDMTADGKPLLLGPGQDFMACIIGAAMCGVGLGIVFNYNGSTGGTDIIIKLLRLKFPYLKTGALFFLTDVVIVIASAFVFQNIDKALYAGIVVIITSVVLDVVLYGRDEAKLIYIISDHAEKIAGRLLEELDIGVTYVQGSGAYSGKEKSVIMCAMKKNISPKAEEIVKEEDPLAFMIVTSATEIFGEGYKSYFSEKL